MSVRHESIDWGISGLTGTLGVTVLDADLAELIPRVTSGIAEDGSSGCYALAIAGWNDSWGANVRVDDGSGEVRTFWLDSAPLTAQQARDAMDLASGGTHGPGSVATQGDLAAVTGAGGRALTVTVNDGTAVLQGVRVTLSQGSDLFWGTTDSSGQVTFGLTDATWAVVLTKSGYQFTPTTRTVTSLTATTQTYSMTQTVVTPPTDPTQTTGYTTTRDGKGDAEGGVDIRFTLISGPGDSGSAYNKAEFTATSGNTGALEVQLLRLARYRMERGTNDKGVTFTTTDTTTYQLPELAGAD